MKEEYDHLILPFIPGEIPRKKIPRGGGLKGRDDKTAFYQQELHELEGIQRNYREQKQRYGKYFNPNLIFKIEITQTLDENTLRLEFMRMGIDIISSSPDSKGYWIVFAEDDDFTEFKNKLKKYYTEDRYKFFNAIGKPISIPPNEKKGELLRENPFGVDEKSYLDIEIWRMDNGNLHKFLNGFNKLIEENGGEITDELTTNNFCLLRIMVNKILYESIMDLREVAHVNRPPKVKLELDKSLQIDLSELGTIEKPSNDATGILLVDSGILSGHPLLENAIGDERSLSTKYSGKVPEDRPSDDVGHGTKIAGIALYGDILNCINLKLFSPKIWIFSAKVMYKGQDGEAEYDERELYEHQLSRAIEWITTEYPNCKIINLSLGDSAQVFSEGIQQSNLATLIDELSREYGLIFIISAGNIDNGTFIELREEYPDYLIKECDKIRIIDPATSALALTVGAVYRYAKESQGTTFGYFPSRGTRVGPGYRRMIKPELVEEGGNGFGTESDIVTTNPNWINEGRLFTLDCGTSFSAPKVAHYAALLLNKYPGSSSNLIKALLLSSAVIPEEKPEELSGIDIAENDENFISIANIYGYGKPDLERASYSSNNKVVLVGDNNIHLNHFQIYSLFLPREFWDTSGVKRISVTLVFDPLVTKNRTNYLGVTMEAHLFKNIEDIELIRRKYGDIEIGSVEGEIVPEDIRSNRISLYPGVNTRKRGAHQKGTVIYSGRPRIKADIPLYLVVICQNRWIKDEENKDDKDYLQDYAIVVSVEHAESIDIYNDIRIRNRARIGLSVKA